MAASSSSGYLVRNLWNAAPVLTTNLLETGLVDTAFNASLAKAAVTAFDDYRSIRLGTSVPGSSPKSADEPKARTRRRRRASSPGRTRAELPAPGPSGPRRSATEEHSISRCNPSALTDNDFFFQHQKNRGYRLATRAIAGSDCARRLQEDYLVQIVSYYLENVCGAKPLADLLALGTGELSIDMWAAVQRGKGAYHADHVHEGALVSGVYYASVPPGSAPLVLRRPGADDIHGTNGEDFRPASSHGEDSDVILPPTEGNLVLFPPWVVHGVPAAEEEIGGRNAPSESDSRVSFAFNVTGAFVLGHDPWNVTRLE
ncbi:unnamed protein product [Pseudo-nitzschia multistriata]|uniref:Fe2OG dioxygenase domain-containing protein n=1 Tax=Pseudo-nitzschia multistriata TaxID=183589 RepID=A0A448YWP2_9STRA|nr:unnamed protein product [Pseudo-nitzschia multistriata]